MSKLTKDATKELKKAEKVVTDNTNKLVKSVHKAKKPIKKSANKTAKTVQKGVNDHKVGIAVAGAVIAVVATSVGVVNASLSKKKRLDKANAKLKELQTEKERLEAVLMTMNKELQSVVNGVEKAVNVRTTGDGFPDDEHAVVEQDEKYEEFKKGLADSLEKTEDDLEKGFMPNETIYFSELDFIKGLTEDNEESTK